MNVMVDIHTFERPGSPINSLKMAHAMLAPSSIPIPPDSHSKSVLLPPAYEVPECEQRGSEPMELAGQSLVWESWQACKERVFAEVCNVRSST